MNNYFFQFLSGKKSFGFIQKLSEKVDLTSFEHELAILRLQ